MMQPGCRDQSRSPFMQMKPVQARNFKETRGLSEYSQKELQCLFADWLSQLEEEVMEDIKDRDSVELKDLAERYHICEDSAGFIIQRLQHRHGLKIKITGNLKED
mgnify:CR=1 FL=1